MKKLFCPGPVNVPIDTIKIATENVIGHRSHEFEQIFSSIKKLTLSLFNAQSSEYMVLPITGSGTLANEMCISSAILPNEKVLLLNNGVFGDRLKRLLLINNVNFAEIVEDFEFDLDKISKVISDNDFSWILIVHNETSTGLLNPISKISNIARNFNIKIMIDAVSSAGVDNINFMDTSPDILTTTSGKALGSFPGVGLICIKRELYNSLKSQQLTIKSDYMDLVSNIDFSETYQQSLHTPSVPIFIALEHQLAKIVSNLYNFQSNYAKMNAMIRSEFINLGITPLLKESSTRSNMLNSFLLPSDIDLGEFINRMNEAGFVLYAGKGKYYKLGMFQVANVGDLQIEDCHDLIQTFKKIVFKI